MIVVSNTYPLSNLAVIRQLTLLQQIYSQIIIPTAVYQELIAIENVRAEITPFLTTSWLEIRAVTNQNLVEMLENELDKGEAEAIVLAIELKADRLLIDEKLGRNVANRYTIKITGLLGILTVAKLEKIIPSVKPLLDSLIQEAGFRVSRELYLRTLQDVSEYMS